MIRALVLHRLAVDAGTHKMTDAEFEAFYDEISRPLWRYVLRASGNSDLANDIVQEAFCRFLQLASPPAGHSERKAYIFKVAINLLRDHWRRTRREESENVDVSHPGQAGRTSGCAEDVRTLFHRLKPRERLLLWLAYVEGATHEEIAGALGLRQGSVKVLLFRARKRFSALLLGNDERGKQ